MRSDANEAGVRGGFPSSGRFCDTRSCHTTFHEAFAPIAMLWVGLGYAHFETPFSDAVVDIRAHRRESQSDFCSEE